MSSSERPRSTRIPGMPEGGKADAPDRGNSAPPAKPMPQPKSPPEETPLAHEHQSPGSSASGFVGMLAKGKLGSGDSHMPELAMAGEEGKPRQPPNYKLRMAREISATRANAAAAKPATKPESRAAVGAVEAKPHAAPEEQAAPAARSAGAATLVALAVLLLALGLWAACALGFMSTTAPAAAGAGHFPLVYLRPPMADGGPAGFTADSWLAAWSLLACLPLAGACLWRAARSRRRK